MKKLHIILCALVWLLLLYNPVYSQSEYAMKAIFIERFTRFIEWPPTSNVHNLDKKFVVGVIGNSKLGVELEKTYDTHTIKQKQVKILYIKNLQDILQCNILFIAESESRRIPLIMEYVGSKPILTISDIPNSYKQGVHITMSMQQSKIAFELNEQAFSKNHLQLDYKLKQYALNASK